VDTGTAKYDLVVALQETNDCVEGGVTYRTELFEVTTIRRMVEGLRRLLEHFLADPDSRLSTVGRKMDAEQARDDVPMRKESLRRLLATQPRRIAVDVKEPVAHGVLEPGSCLPPVYFARSLDVDLERWARDRRDVLLGELTEHGALLFRGFQPRGPAEFERFAKVFTSKLFADYGDLPRESVEGAIYTSTPYPSDQSIHLHNESSHLSCWPLWMWFICVQAPECGGETTVADCREVYRRLDPVVRQQFEKRGLTYLRIFHRGIDTHWPVFFRTTDRSEVERLCHAMGMSWEWTGAHGIRTRMIRPAIAIHPHAQLPVFFNQIQTHHPFFLSPDVRAALLTVFREEELPRNVIYGDGNRIEDETLTELQRTFADSERVIKWRQGDILMVDNMLVAHGRRPFAGPRRVLVAMGEMTSARSEFV
jgi:alpha-ketoglutarate-dependent taurine dioxygenase